MRALLLIAGLLAVSSPARAMSTDEIAALFFDACMGGGPHDQTVETLGRLRGWSKVQSPKEQSPLPSQAITGSTWTVSSQGTEVTPPVVQVSEMAVVNRPETPGGPAWMCMVTDKGDRLDEIAARVQKQLQMSAPTRGMRDAGGFTTQWVLTENPLDAVSLTQSSRRSGPVTMIVRAQTPAQEKR
ncbi:hypothetical protein [Methylobacterium sp. Leaf94]|uniref:hypothetical protein n=2 Tax=unclassified Methylobacterium TaxID=2615210 RepID=UPI0006FA2C94|nr:hypothetical protein [Methylobacterium sp. Leaf94]